MNTIKQWFQSKGGFSHVAAAVFTSLMLAYAAVPSFHALVIQVHATLPGWLQELFTTALALYAWYKTTNAKTQSPASTSTTAKLVVLLMLGFITFGALGCKTSTVTPATAPSVTALSVLQEVQSDVLAVQQAEISAVKAGLIDRATDLILQKAFVHEAQDATALADAISTTVPAATVQAKVTALLNDVQQDVASGVAGVKDANTKAAITASISAAEIAINSIMSAYNTGK